MENEEWRTGNGKLKTKNEERGIGNRERGEWRKGNGE